MTALTVAATATEGVHVGSCVLQLPLREARGVAKQTSALQLLTGGRMILGVGVGSHPGEYEQAGVDFHTRGRRLDAGIHELHRSWATATDTAPSGQDRPRDEYRMLPAVPSVPVWIGGSSEAALRRAARIGDGWMPLFLDPVEYGGALERLAKEVDRAGRPQEAVTPAMVLFVSVDDDVAHASRRGAAWMSSMYGIPAKAFERHLVAGTPSQVAESVAAYRRAGAEHVALYVTADDPLPQFERLVGALGATPTPGDRA
jgi:alkanesulfonate monooxygenase SsuD/methylene tetrahydromethanopterin reductase-like flavin-dependent oxidoreductase (luciferase family)